MKRLTPKTHCKRGHEFTPENTYVYSRAPNAKQCRICRKMHDFNGHLKNLYHGTLEQYRLLTEKQKGLCATCGKPEQRRTRLFIDHDHSTGKMRELLCGQCNLALGTVDDDPKLLIRLAEYVLEHREKEAICELQSGS